MGRMVTPLGKPKKPPADAATVGDSLLSRYGAAQATLGGQTQQTPQQTSVIQQSSLNPQTQPSGVANSQSLLAQHGAKQPPPIGQRPTQTPANPTFDQTPEKKPPNPNDVQQDAYNSPVQNISQQGGGQQTPMQSLTERYGSLAAQQGEQTVPEQAPAMQQQAANAGAPTKEQGIEGVVPSRESQQTWARPLTDSTQPMAGPTGFVSFQQRYGANAGAAAAQAAQLASRVGRTAEVAKDALAREADPSVASQGTRDKYAALEDQADALGGAGGIEALLDDQGAATGDDAMFAQQAGGATLRGLADRYGNAQQDLTDAEAAGSLAQDEASLAAEAELARQQGERNAADKNPDAAYQALRESKIAEFMAKGYTRAEAESEADLSLGSSENKRPAGMARAEG